MILRRTLLAACVAALCTMTMLLAPLKAQTPASAPQSVSEGARATLEGRITDASGPVLAADVVLLIDGQVQTSATSTADGRYSLRVSPGRYTLRVTRIGYADVTRLVSLTPDATTRADVELQPAAVMLEGLGVEATAARDRVRFESLAGVSVRELGRDEVKGLPGLAEPDPLRAIQVLPGVVTTSDFSSSFHVRGGSADQNLILLDGAPVFSPYHLGGAFSVFNADMVERAELTAGGFGVRHGGRVSSLLRVESDPGDGDFGADMGVTLLAARMALKGGIGSDVRWRLSARRSYVDQLLQSVVDMPYAFHDLQGVLEWTPSPQDRVRVTAYTGNDALDFTEFDPDDFPLRVDWGWGNDVAGVNWTRSYAAGQFSVGASTTRFATGLTMPDFDDTDFRSRIDQQRAYVDVDVRPSPMLQFKVGSSVERFSYDNLSTTAGAVFNEGAGEGTQIGGYTGLTLGRAGDWLIDLGLRADLWSPSLGEAATELSPRLGFKTFFGTGSRWALHASAGRYTQFLHSLRDEELPVGLDTWVLADQHTPYVVSDQLQLGLAAYPSDEWEVSLEGYLRDFDGVVSFNVRDDPNTEADDVLQGAGRSWGADLMVKKRQGHVQGWAALSYLDADRTFPDVLSPRQELPMATYAPIFDRRVDLDLVLSVPGPFGWETGMRMNVGSGTPYTRPIASYAAYQPRTLELGGRFDWNAASDILLGDRNGSRYPLYHRLDLSFRKTFTKSWGSLTPHLDILNVYNQRNVLFYYFEYEDDPVLRTGTSMFPILPTLGLEISF